MPTINQHLIGQEIYLDPELSTLLKLPYCMNENVVILPAQIIRDSRPTDQLEAVTYCILMACDDNYLQLRGTKYPGFWTIDSLKPNHYANN
jgi:hypothetical protein